MPKRTSVNLDLDLVQQAAAVLGTHRSTDALHRALEDVVLRERRRLLATRGFSPLTLEAVESMRKPRVG